MPTTNIQIIAILPEEIKSFGIGARVYTPTTTHLIEETPTLFLNKMYKKRGKNKKEMDQIIKYTLQISKNMPYIIDTSHVFFGFKYRNAVYDRERRGFANVSFVEKIENSEIILTTGESIATLNTFETLNTNKNNAKTMLYRQQLIASYDWAETLDQIRNTVMRETAPRLTEVRQSLLD